MLQLLRLFQVQLDEAMAFNLHCFTNIFVSNRSFLQWGGGWLSELGFSDFAGSTLVHAAGASAALAGAIVLGPRIGKYKDDGSVTNAWIKYALATLGTFILWLGWFGFNGGSQHIGFYRRCSRCL